MGETIKNMTEDLDQSGVDFLLSEATRSSELLIASWLAVQLVGTPLFLGIVSFKMNGSLNYQTLIDKLNVYFYFLGVFYSLTGFNVIGLRAFTALPTSLCTLQILELHCLVFAACATACETFILRYFYSCVWKNIGALNDDFVAWFLILANSLLSFAYGAVLAVTKDFDGVALSLCDGSEPELSASHAKIFSRPIHPTFLAIMATCVSSAILNTAIHFKSRKADPIVAGHRSGTSVASMFGMGKLLEVLVTAANVMGVLPRLHIGSMLRGGRFSDVSPTMLAFSMVASPLVFYTVFPFSIYARNSQLRKHVSGIVADWPILRSVGRFLSDIKKPKINLKVKPKERMRVGPKCNCHLIEMK